MARAILRELSTAIVQDVVQDPRVNTLITLYDAEVSSDLLHVKVRVGGALNRRAIQRSTAGLNSASGFLQHYLNKKLRFRRVPHLHFLPLTTIKKNFTTVQKLDAYAQRSQRSGTTQ